MTAIKIVKELIQIVCDIATPILEEVDKDGFQGSDLLAFLQSDKFREDFTRFLKEVFNRDTEAK
ncbi:MAG: hypothetical protein ACP5N7_01090 [Candidatus Pacearchaeota archaeon]